MIMNTIAPPKIQKTAKMTVLMQKKPISPFSMTMVFKQMILLIVNHQVTTMTMMMTTIPMMKKIIPSLMLIIIIKKRV